MKILLLHGLDSPDGGRTLQALHNSGFTIENGHEIRTPQMPTVEMRKMSYIVFNEASPVRAALSHCGMVGMSGME